MPKHHTRLHWGTQWPEPHRHLPARYRPVLEVLFSFPPFFLPGHLPAGYLARENRKKDFDLFIRFMSLIYSPGKIKSWIALQVPHPFGRTHSGHVHYRDLTRWGKVTAEEEEEEEEGRGGGRKDLFTHSECGTTWLILITWRFIATGEMQFVAVGDTRDTHSRFKVSLFMAIGDTRDTLTL